MKKVMIAVPKKHKIINAMSFPKLATNNPTTSPNNAPNNNPTTSPNNAPTNNPKIFNELIFFQDIGLLAPVSIPNLYPRMVQWAPLLQKQFQYLQTS